MSPEDDVVGPTFRPFKDGLAKVLGELEAEVMECVWSEAEPVSARHVEEQVGRPRGIQYITLVTVLNNLCRKGLLTREKEGRAFYYLPRMTRDQYVEKVSREILSGVMGLGREAALRSFVDVLAENAPDELEVLKKRLAERKGEEEA
jgi:predicted transcriptional regulator